MIATVYSFGLAFVAKAQVDVTSHSAVFPGPYQATIAEFIDGDTIAVNIALRPGLRTEYSIRIRRMDTPEIFRPDCDEEREWGKRARAQGEKLYPLEQEVQITNVQYNSFSGRVVADVKRWLSYASEILERSMAVEWEPQQQNVPWCLLALGDQ